MANAAAADDAPFRSAIGSVAAANGDRTGPQQKSTSMTLISGLSANPAIDGTAADGLNSTSLCGLASFRPKYTQIEKIYTAQQQQRSGGQRGEHTRGGSA
jgi:hypothetical protein